jgi:hypothetical protein
MYSINKRDEINMITYMLSLQFGMEYPDLCQGGGDIQNF